MSKKHDHNLMVESSQRGEFSSLMKYPNLKIQPKQKKETIRNYVFDIIDIIQNMERGSVKPQRNFL